MGKCNNCNIDISDDQELCDDCKKLELVENDSKESYLDELLNSVATTQSEESANTRNIRKRRIEHRSKVDSNQSSEQMINDEVNQGVLKNNEEQGETVENMEKREPDDLQDLINTESMDMDSIDLDPIGMDQIDISSTGKDSISMDEMEDIESSEFEDQSYDINNIFDFMDMVGGSSESVDWSSKNVDSDNDTKAFDETNKDDFSDNLSNDLGSNLDTISVLDNDLDSTAKNNMDKYESQDNNDTSSLEDDILTEDTEDINELLDFLSNEENATSLDLNNESMNDLDMSIISREDNISFDDTINMNSSFDIGSDIGDVFSDTLGAVTTLDDPADMEDLSSIAIPKITEEDRERKLKEKERKRSIFKELFFGPDEDDLEVEISKESKSSKKAKGSKNKTKIASTNEETKDHKKSILDFFKKKNAKNKDKKAKVIKQTKEKKLKKEEEVEIDRGRINKYATMIIFSIFAAFAIVIISGTEIISYSSSISKATVEFKRQRYDYAYDALEGIDIKDKDMELYDKVVTVMFVNKQLNSYNNFYSIGAYPQALDSLLKGLKRYDKYIDLAKEIGIESDLNYVRNQILSELKQSYQLSEEGALDILKSEDQKSYSIKLYDAVNKNISLVEKGKE